MPVIMPIDLLCCNTVYRWSLIFYSTLLAPSLLLTTISIGYLLGCSTSSMETCPLYISMLSLYCVCSFNNYWRAIMISVELVHLFIILPSMQILSKENRAVLDDENSSMIYETCLSGLHLRRTCASTIWHTLIMQPHPTSPNFPSSSDR